MRMRLLLALVTLLVLLATGTVLHLHVDSSRLLTHTVGVFALLAELLRHGVLYPPEPTTDLVYAVFYHPLGFAPYALLPGSGLDLVASMRVLVGSEVVLGLGLVAWLARPAVGPAYWSPAWWALCTLPVCFSLVGMRDDPRAALWALLAMLAYGGEGTRRARPVLAGVCLAIAFFVKATAPAAAGAALCWAAWREGDHAGRRRVLALLAACAGLGAAGVAFLQLGLGCDFLGNGLYYLFVAPAREPRPWSAAWAALGRDLCGWQPGSGQPIDLALPVLLAGSALLLAVRAARRRWQRYDVLVAVAWLKTVAAYRSWGTDLNHLFDLTLFAALHAARGLGSWLTPVRALALFAIALGLGQPWRRLLPEPGTPSLADSPLAAAAAGLRAQQPPLPTLCEEPLLAWLSDSRPLVTDPFLTFAALRRSPTIRARWFGPADHPAAVQRLVLMHDPFSDRPHVEHWYRHLHFDAEFLHMVRQHWRAVLVTDTATVLVRNE